MLSHLSKARFRDSPKIQGCPLAEVRIILEVAKAPVAGAA